MTVSSLLGILRVASSFLLYIGVADHLIRVVWERAARGSHLRYVLTSIRWITVWAWLGSVLITMYAIWLHRRITLLGLAAIFLVIGLENIHHFLKNLHDDEDNWWKRRWRGIKRRLRIDVRQPLPTGI